ncbi:MAG: hypothetical protein EOP63_10020 [Sphingomonadales bacterium]|nr:MAG: hypothetical protein EOP63_10020 [Sphingomonadales bacterium]
MSFLFALAILADPDAPEIRYQHNNGASNICGVSAFGPAELVEKILALPDLKRVEQIGQYLTLMQERDRRFWTLVIDDHPAAPAVICRTITPAAGGGSTLAMEISCFADKASCDKLTADFVAHNQSVLRGEKGV